MDELTTSHHPSHPTETGDGNLGLICSKIAGDESRHEKAYQAIFAEILKKDPEGGLRSMYV